ncbi:MAG TPA: hypothetical protein ENI87_14225 [bacterium]|nr:hypothetical protein [bacterium]
MARINGAHRGISEILAGGMPREIQLPIVAAGSVRVTLSGGIDVSERDVVQLVGRHGVICARVRGERLLGRERRMAIGAGEYEARLCRGGKIRTTCRVVVRAGEDVALPW